MQQIAEVQVTNNNLPGISYHYCINAEGQVFQTEPLEAISTQAGNFSSDSIGICLIGDFTDTPPPQAQLDATAGLLAQLVTRLGLSTDQIFGYRDLVAVSSPGATWPTWKDPLLTEVQNLMATGIATQTPTPSLTATPTP